MVYFSRTSLKLEKLHIYGEGFGGMLALSYLQQYGMGGIASLTLTSTPASYQTLINDRREKVRSICSLSGTCK